MDLKKLKEVITDFINNIIEILGNNYVIVVLVVLVLFVIIFTYKYSKKSY